MKRKTRWTDSGGQRNLFISFSLFIHFNAKIKCLDTLKRFFFGNGLPRHSFDLGSRSRAMRRQEVGFDFRQVGLDFRQRGLDFRKVCLDFKQVGK